MQRAILQALDLAPPEALPWAPAPMDTCVLPEAPPVLYWAVPDVRQCVARLRGTWCAGECPDVWHGIRAQEGFPGENAKIWNMCDIFAYGTYKIM